LPDYKRYSASISTSERFDDFLRAQKPGLILSVFLAFARKRYLDEWLRLASAASGEAAQLDKPEIPITLVKASRCKHDGMRTGCGNYWRSRD
jgi:hypothetical protein